jgi:hypothetical protein
MLGSKIRLLSQLGAIAPWWRRLRAEILSWMALAVLEAPWCPGPIADIVIAQAQKWAIEAGR